MKRSAQSTMHSWFQKMCLNVPPYAGAKVREWANTLSGREQLAAVKFAEALEVIPLTLAENAGMDLIDTLTELRAKQSKGSHSIGIDARNGKVADMSKLDIFEPLVVNLLLSKSK